MMHSISPTIPATAVAVLTFLGLSWAQSPTGRVAKTPQATVELISASAALPTAGGEIWAGLRFTLEPGWHVSWRNPGDSGGPPTVKWQGPAGLTPGEFEWPVPERITLGSLVNYGYEGDIVLPVRLRATAAAAKTPQTLGADVRWLVCKDVCVPGKARLALTWPASTSEATQWKGQIDRALAAVPKSAPAAWKATAVSERDTFVVTLRLDRPAPATAVFFPIDESQINESAAQAVSASGRDLDDHVEEVGPALERSGDAPRRGRAGRRAGLHGLGARRGRGQAIGGQCRVASHS